MMRFWPVGGPLKEDPITGSYYRVTFSIFSFKMADDIRGPVGVLFHKVSKVIDFGQRGHQWHNIPGATKPLEVFGVPQATTSGGLSV
jgi:hypothetical protein